MSDNAPNTKLDSDGATSPIHDLLVKLTSAILETPFDSHRTLVAQGLDSLGAIDLLDAIQSNGYDVDYEYLLGEASIDSLAVSLREKTTDGPTPSSAEISAQAFALTGPQVLWANIEQQGWGSWANISICVSMPACVVSAAFLPAIAQSLCDANDAMRMVLIKSPSTAAIAQRTIPNFQIPVKMCEAPKLKRDAMRLVEAFEGEKASPFAPSTRALILSASGKDSRHWLCITMHHIFSDRVSMQSLTSQIRAMISKNELRVSQQPPIGYIDYALWQTRIAATSAIIQSQTRLNALLARANISPRMPMPVLANAEFFDLGELPAFSSLSCSQSDALESLATQLETTLPLLLHTLFSVLVTQLTGDEKAACGETDMLLCHVVSNRERHASLRTLVGCLDTSVPVAVSLNDGQTLRSLCVQTRLTFADTYQCVSSRARGQWLSPEASDGNENLAASLFERVPHINIIRSPHGDSHTNNDADIQEHPVQRAQKTRWGLLLRVTLPPSDKNIIDGTKDGSFDSAAIRISAFAEHRPLASLAHYCFVGLLRALLSEPPQHRGELQILDQVNLVIKRAAFAAAQVRKTAAMVLPGSMGESFIYDKLLARQQRWYEHDERYELRRDQLNRFIGTAANPFPFTQLDKLKERQFLDNLEVPQPTLIHVIPKENLHSTLMKIAPSLPTGFVVKPVGAGHSFGVTVVRNSMDLTRNGLPFDAAVVAAELLEMADKGFCIHQGKTFPFNFSSFLIEKLVVDERDFPTPTDYKVFMLGEKLLWIQLHFKEAGHSWVAFVNADFEILAQPAWDPSTCWRTHGALVCTEQTMVAARKPACLSGILEQSKRLAAHMNIFVRLDWYADKTDGPLMGEITTFPHMLQPRSFYSPWANNLVKTAWQDYDGVATAQAAIIHDNNCNLVASTQELLSKDKNNRVGLEDFMPLPSKAPWDVGDNLSYGSLRTYVANFDLAPWGVTGGQCVAVLLGNGVALAGLLLASMNRYVTLPIASALPSSLVVAQLQQNAVKALLVIAQTPEARNASEIARHIPGLIIIELIQNPFFTFASLPTPPHSNELLINTPTRGPNDNVLILRTSGSTGEPKIVSFTLARLMSAGAIISHSLKLCNGDVGISMLPLHHVGGIACNLISPLLAAAPMRFYKAFDPRAFFDALAGKNGATWCYLVPTMWDMVVQYAKAQPELQRMKPWPQLRVIRSAGSELPHDLARKLADLFGNAVSILPTYGMTEAMPVAAPPLSYRLARPGSVGFALATVSIEIVDYCESGGLLAVADGTIGEVTVKGPTVLHHDIHAGHSSCNQFTPRGYFRTGDLGKLAADGSGWLFINGRIKDVINRGGETIAPAEVEAILRSYPMWQNAEVDVQLMIFARTHSDLGEDVALAVAPLTVKVDLAQLNVWAQQHLPASMLPQTLVLLPELPRGDNSKLQRRPFAKKVDTLLAPGELGKLQTYVLEGYDATLRLLEEVYAQKPEQNLNIDELNVTLESVLTVVRSYLGEGQDIGPDSRLDDAGVNSLAAVELSGRLNDHFHSQLPAWVISDYPTPRALFSQLIKNPLTALQFEAKSKQQATDFAGRSSSAQLSRVKPLRMLFLHGEGADAELMDLSMQATRWTGNFESSLEFVFIDAPHKCAPKPEFHAAAAAVGLYEKTTYRTWGAIHKKTLEHSIAVVVSALDRLGPIDAIGGICDGGLVAAWVASTRPDIKLYLNVSASPITRLPSIMAKADWTITCPTIHLISRQDEVHSFQQLVQISQRCKKALLLQHDHGHCVPMLDDNLKREIRAVLNDINTVSEHGTCSAPLAKTTLGDIESLISSHESIDNAIVIEYPDSHTNSQRLYAFVVLNQYAATPPGELKAFLKTHLPEHLVPARFIPISTIPLAKDGNIDHGALIEKMPKAFSDFASPRTELEQEFVDIWQTLLMMEHKPGIDDDFFELGGYSLLSMMLLTETKRRLSIELPPKALLSLSTIRHLVDILKESEGDQAKHIIEPEQNSIGFEGDDRLSLQIHQGLLAHVAAWQGKRSRPESLVFGMNVDAPAQAIFWCCQGFQEFSQLSKHLGIQQPIYGMRSGHLVMIKSQSNIESLAKHYVSEILTIQQQGPYIIGGNCQSAKIAFQIARQLQKLGHHISLLCLQEQVVPLKYSGRVALFFGDKSVNSPAHYFDDPQRSWLPFYSHKVSVNAITGEHGRFFETPNIETLAAKIQAEIDKLKSVTVAHINPITPIPTPILPTHARQANIQAPKQLFVARNEKVLQIMVKVTNASVVTWPAKIDSGIVVGYWIYMAGIKPPIFYGLGKGLPKDLAPGKSITFPLEIVVPTKLGVYRVDVDLLDNGFAWFQFNGSCVATITLDSRTRLLKTAAQLNIPRQKLRGIMGRVAKLLKRTNKAITRQ
ncbi:MAG: acyl-CoA synthetase (AMP-forming)/AMP-acid ligase II/acyl carrier protein [Kangiellaceae bacterium]